MKTWILAVIMAASVGFTLFVPVVPLEPYGPQYNLPHQIFVQTKCFGQSGCPIVTITGQCWVSISYEFFGLGEYLFINVYTFYYWAFIT